MIAEWLEGAPKSLCFCSSQFLVDDFKKLSVLLLIETFALSWEKLLQFRKSGWKLWL